jgi:hypothetical protein
MVGSCVLVDGVGDGCGVGLVAAGVPLPAAGDAVFGAGVSPAGAGGGAGGVCAQAAETPSDEISTDADANKRARNAMNAPVRAGEL